MTATVIPFPSPMLTALADTKPSTEWWSDERAPAFQDCLAVRYTRERGRGVFSVIPAPRGAIIEVAPYVPVPVSEIEDDDVLAHYVYEVDERAWGLALGYASLYNHANDPNLTWEVDVPSKRILFRALRDIVAGEELTIDYRGGADEPLWFEVR